MISTRKPLNPLKFTSVQIEQVVRKLDPGCMRDGDEMKMLNPHREDNKRNSFGINLKTQLWKDFAVEGVKGKGLTSLVVYHQRTTKAEALQKISQFLTPSPSGTVASATAIPSPPAWPAAPKDAAPPKSKLAGHDFIQAWCYRDGTRKPVLWVARFEKDGVKTIRPYRWDGRWNPGDPPGKLPLYNLDRLTAESDAPVLIVEGEKAADAAQERFPDYICTTSPHGANSASKAFWGSLKGRSVTIWPDHDDPGQSYARDVTKELEGIAANVSIVQVPSSFPGKWDLADEVPDGADLDALLKEAKPGKTLRPLATHVLGLQELLDLPIPPRAYLIDPWLAEGSLNMVYAQRGIGKSWFALQLAITLSRGEDFFVWKTGKARRVLLVDGEMPLVVIQHRLRALAGKTSTDNMDILPSEPLWQEGRPLNLNDTVDQARIQELLDQFSHSGRRPNLIIFDNLSSLTAGTDENDNGALDSILQWLMGLRHQGYAVLLVHHTGKSGDQRGASRREDLLDTSIKLTESSELGEAPGAAFDLEFTKTRDRRPKPDRLSVMLQTSPTGSLSWHIANAVSEDAKILQAIKDTAPKSVRALATTLHQSPTTIGKKLSTLRKRGLVQAPAKPIALTTEGAEACSNGRGRIWKCT